MFLDKKHLLILNMKDVVGNKNWHFTLSKFIKISVTIFMKEIIYYEINAL